MRSSAVRRNHFSRCDEYLLNVLKTSNTRMTDQGQLVEPAEPAFCFSDLLSCEELIHSFIRQKPNNIMLRQQTIYFNIHDPKISINDIHTSQWPFYCLNFKCDLDLQLTLPKVSNEQMCQIILKSMHKCRSYGPDKLNLWPFYHLTFQCDSDLKPTWKNVSNGISTCEGEQLWHIILKSMHNVEVMAQISSFYG